MTLISLVRRAHRRQDRRFEDSLQDAMPINQGTPLHIGLVNNMPGAALQATERQFRGLLDEAARGLGVTQEIRLSLFTLPEVPRSAEERSYLDGRYAPLEQLFDGHLDGLIVTGAEPRTANLYDEPYWPRLQQLVAWADRHTRSSLWSCLAAHAAVLHLDGIARQPLGKKLSGVFVCERVNAHPLTTVGSGTAGDWRMPHSRWNELPQDALANAGYQILTRSAVAGVDTFIRQRHSLFLFCQGHPEYDSDSLLLEYRRDIRRYLLGERKDYPSVPRGLFEEPGIALIDGFRERALARRAENTLAEFPAATLAAQLPQTWRPAAVGLYRQWLAALRGG